MKIGTAVTTRNRPECLELHLEQMLAYEPEGVGFRHVVVDDASDPGHAARNRELAGSFGFEYVVNPERRGVARTKNVCLRELDECDHLFLFDDDAFPDAQDWWQPFVAGVRVGCRHSMYMNQTHSLVACRGPFDEYSWGMGVCLFISRCALDVIGGFDPRFGTYGYEHFSFTERAAAAGLTGGYGKYISPRDAEGRIFSLDYDYYAQGREPSLRPVSFPFRASVVGETRQSLTTYGKVFFDSDRATLFVPYGEQDELDILGEACTEG
jgi:GT2 family glycosyltransferase